MYAELFPGVSRTLKQNLLIFLLMFVVFLFPATNCYLHFPCRQTVFTNVECRQTDNKVKCEIKTDLVD